jgi:DNA polymerase-3 subunit gamma/tau
VVHLIESLGEAQREIRDGLDPRLQLELALIKATRPHVDHTMAALEERLRRLESAVTVGAIRSSVQHGGASTLSGAPKTAAAMEDDGGPAGSVAVAGRSARPEATPTESAGADPRPLSAVVPDPPVELTLERVKRAWDLVLQRVQTSSVSLYALLREARPTALEDGLLTVAISSNVALTRAREPGNAELLAAAAESALGVPFQAVFVAGAAPADSPAKPSPAPLAAELDFTQQIRHAQERLEAELMPDEP